MENELGGSCGPNGKAEKLYKVLVGKPEGKRPLGRPRSRWGNGIRMDLGETDWRNVELIHLAQIRDQWRGSHEYGDEPSRSGATELVTGL
jgi:hypothetical protein